MPPTIANAAANAPTVMLVAAHGLVVSEWCPPPGDRIGNEEPITRGDGRHGSLDPLMEIVGLCAEVRGTGLHRAAIEPCTNESVGQCRMFIVPAGCVGDERDVITEAEHHCTR